MWLRFNNIVLGLLLVVVYLLMFTLVAWVFLVLDYLFLALVVVLDVAFDFASFVPWVCWLGFGSLVGFWWEVVCVGGFSGCD